MRIVGGQLRGRKINAPKGTISRPTTDRVREALFNILAHHDEIELEGARVIDLFAGSGALGLEALSRGAKFSLFVEQDSGARAAIRDNIEDLSLFGSTKIHRRSAISLGELPASAGGKFSLAFMDPPYRKNLIAPAMQGLVEGGWLEAGAYLIVETAKDDLLEQITGFEKVDQRIYGDSAISFFRWNALSSPA